jgi:DNA-binding CsgD family transcriptional regulator
MLSPFEERQVLAMHTRDLSVAQIGRELRISPFAVRTFERSILTKLRLHSDLEAVTVGKERKGPPRRAARGSSYGRRLPRPGSLPEAILILTLPFSAASSSSMALLALD